MGYSCLSKDICYIFTCFIYLTILLFSYVVLLGTDVLLVHFKLFCENVSNFDDPMVLFLCTHKLTVLNMFALLHILDYKTHSCIKRCGIFNKIVRILPNSNIKCSLDRSILSHDKKGYH